MQCMTCACVFKPLFGVNNLFIIHTIYFVIQLYKTPKMQRSNQDFIDYSPVPDSPPQSPREPEMLNESMRSDPSPVFARQHRFWRHRHRTQHRTQQRRPQERRRQWRDVVQVPEENEEEERRVFKGKWGPRFCRNQSCKKSPRRSPRSPRSPPPPTAAMVAGGTQTKTKTRTNRSKKYKNKRRK